MGFMRHRQPLKLTALPVQNIGNYNDGKSTRNSKVSEVAKKETKKMEMAPIIPTTPPRELMSEDTPAQTRKKCPVDTQAENHSANIMTKLTIDIPFKTPQLKMVREISVESLLGNISLRTEGFPKVTSKKRLEKITGEPWTEKLAVLISFDPVYYCPSLEINRNYESRKIRLPVPKVSFFNIKIRGEILKRHEQSGINTNENIVPQVKIQTTYNVYSDAAPAEHRISILAQWEPVVFLDAHQPRGENLIVMFPDSPSEARQPNRPRRVIVLRETLDSDAAEQELPKRWICLNPESTYETTAPKRVFIINPRSEIPTMRSHPPKHRIRPVIPESGRTIRAHLIIVRTVHRIQSNQSGNNGKSNQTQAQVDQDDNFLLSALVFTPQLREFLSYDIYGGFATNP